MSVSKAPKDGAHPVRHRGGRRHRAAAPRGSRGRRQALQRGAVAGVGRGRSAGRPDGHDQQSARPSSRLGSVNLTAPAEFTLVDASLPASRRRLGDGARRRRRVARPLAAPGRVAAGRGHRGRRLRRRAVRVGRRRQAGEPVQRPAGQRVRARRRPQQPDDDRHGRLCAALLHAAAGRPRGGAPDRHGLRPRRGAGRRRGDRRGRRARRLGGARQPQLRDRRRSRHVARHHDGRGRGRARDVRRPQRRRARDLPSARVGRRAAAGRLRRLHDPAGGGRVRGGRRLRR